MKCTDASRGFVPLPKQWANVQWPGCLAFVGRDVILDNWLPVLEQRLNQPLDADFQLGEHHVHAGIDPVFGQLLTLYP